MLFIHGDLQVAIKHCVRNCQRLGPVGLAYTFVSESSIYYILSLYFICDIA